MRLVKHIHLLPRSPSECQSDDVATTAPRDTLPHPVSHVTRSPTPFAVRIIAYEKNIHSLFNYSYFTNDHRRTFRVFLCDISCDNPIAYMILLNVMNNYSRGVFLIFQHCLNFLVLFNNSYLKLDKIFYIYVKIHANFLNIVKQFVLNTALAKSTKLVNHYLIFQLIN